MHIKEICSLIKNWSSKYIYLIIFVGYILANLAFVNTYSLHSIKSWVIAVSIVVVFGICGVIVKIHRAFPKIKKNECGIIFALDVENEEQYKLIHNRFIKPFQIHLKRHDSGFQVKLLNPFCMEKYNALATTKDKINNFLKKNNYKFVFEGRCVSGEENEKFICRIYMDGTRIIHDGMNINKHKEFEKDIFKCFMPIKSLEISKSSVADDFEVASKRLELIFEYIFGLSNLLCGKFEVAHRVFSCLVTELYNVNETEGYIDEIRTLSINRLCFCCNELAGNEIDRFYKDKNRERLNIVRKYLHEIEKYDSNYYQCKSTMAIYFFIESRNIKQAVACLESCKNEKTEWMWRINLAFLKLYEGDTISNFLFAYRAYKKIYEQGFFNITTATEVDEFIYMVLDEEPEKKQLNFILMLIYHYGGNSELEAQYYNEFKMHYAHYFDNKEIKGMLKRLELQNEEKCIKAMCEAV